MAKKRSRSVDTFAPKNRGASTKQKSSTNAKNSFSILSINEANPAAADATF